MKRTTPKKSASAPRAAATAAASTVAATAAPVAEAPPAAVRVEGDLTIYHAAELRAVLLRELAQGARRFDLSGVGEIDSAGLQLLAALRASVAGAGGRAEFLAPPACVRDVLALCGLDAWFDAAA